MNIFWWKIKEEFEKSKNQTQNGSKNGETFETNIPKGNSWIYYFKREQAGKVNVGVGDSDINEEKTLCEIFFGKNKWKERKRKQRAETLTDPEHSKKLSMSLHTQANLIQKELIASGFASIISTLIGHPLDVIKGNFQELRYPRQQHMQRMSYFYFVKHTLMTKGIGLFYRGLWESERLSVFQVFSMFYTYEQITNYLRSVEELKKYPNLVNFTSGLVSATLPVLLIYPLRNLKERLEIKKKIRKRFESMVVNRTELDLKTFRPLFGGCFSLFVYMGTQYGLRFLFYNKIRSEMIKQHAQHDKATSTNRHVSSVDSINILTNAQLIFAGGMAGVLADLFAHPLDVIYTRLHMSTLKRQQYKYDHTCRKFGQCILTILKHESISAFYSGLLSSMLRSMVNVAVQFAIYEKTKHWLRLIFPT